MSAVTGISGIQLSAASAAYAPTNSADVSAIASAYATGKQDALTFGYDGTSISSIDGSALAGGGEQVVTSLQYATSESATIASTVTADTAVGYGARDFSADYYDYGYGPWAYYDSSRPLVQVRLTAIGDMANYSSEPYYLYMVPYGATNDGNVSNTGDLTGALAFGEFSGGMNDFIIAEGTGSAYSQDPNYVVVNFDVTHVPFVGSEPAWWGTEPGYSVVDDSETAMPVFCVAGGYDGYELFQVRSNATAEVDFGSLVTVSAVSGINELNIYTTAGGGIDSATVSAIASSYARDVSAAASGAVSAVSSNSASWMKQSSFSGFDGIVTAVGSSYGFGVSASAFMGIDSALKGTTGTLSGSDPYIYYTAQLPDGVSNAVILSSVDVAIADTVDIYYKDYNDYTLSVSLDSNLRQKAIVTNATGILTAMSHNSAFQIGFTAKQPEALAFQSDLTGAGVDSATVSAIASAYAESAVSAVSGDYYSTSNPSGFITSAPFDSATCSAIASSYAESAVSSVSGNYYTTANESGYALSADVSGTVDLVSTQSANWGGSALALSAGPGVKLEKVDDTLVASTDETLLWSGVITSNQTAALSESIANFRSVKVYGYTHNGSAFSWASEVPVQNTTIFGVGLGLWSGSNQELDFSRFALSNTTVSALSGTWLAGGTMGNATANVTKVYGINRTAEA